MTNLNTTIKTVTPYQGNHIGSLPIKAVMHIQEKSHEAATTNYRLILHQEIEGFFTVDALARAYMGSWAIDRDMYQNSITFAPIRKGEIIYQTDIWYSMEHKDRCLVYDYYLEMYDLWSEQRSKRSLNRDEAVRRMSEGHPTSRVKVALKYPQYLHLVPKNWSYNEFKRELDQALTNT